MAFLNILGLFFSFLTRIIIRTGMRSIWCGTHMKIRNMELNRPSAGGKVEDVVVFTNFTYLKPFDLAKLLSKWLNTPLEPLFLQNASHLLQGRPRFLISFLHQLRSISVNDQINTTLHQILNNYCSFLTTRVGIGSDFCLCCFWSERVDLDIVPFQSTRTTKNISLISNILIRLCISFLFGNGESIDMVATGLVMVNNVDTNGRTYVSYSGAQSRRSKS